MPTLYFIPIRKGSKGVHNKNMKLLGGKPLVSHVIDAIIASGTLDEIWVATDSDEAELYLKTSYSARVSIYRRSDESARDESPPYTCLQGIAEEDLCPLIKWNLDDFLWRKYLEYKQNQEK